MEEFDNSLGDEIEQTFPGKSKRKQLEEDKFIDERMIYNLIQKLTPGQRKSLIQFLSDFTIYGSPKR